MSAPASKSLVSVAYPALRGEIVQIFQAGKERAQQAVEQEKARTYWEVGRVLHAHLLAHRDRSGYGEQVVGKLAKDVGIRERLLYEMIELYRKIQILPPGAKLTWSHYRRILSLPTRAERTFYIRAASAAAWNVRDLEAQIRAEAFRNGKTPVEEGTVSRTWTGPPLLPKRGRLYTYRVVEPPPVGGDARLPCLDLGFELYYAPASDGKDSPAPGGIVETVREEDAPERYHFEVSQAGREKLYTYRAVVEKVVDGDTLWTRVDCGFRAWTRQKLRLRGIDAPEISTAAGQRARDFVTQALAGVHFVVLTTTKPDKYDRYLSDVFYLPGENSPQDVLDKGVFLNQQLLDQGMAVRFQDR